MTVEMRNDAKGGVTGCRCSTAFRADSNSDSGHSLAMTKVRSVVKGRIDVV